MGKENKFLSENDNISHEYDNLSEEELLKKLDEIEKEQKEQKEQKEAEI